MSKTIKFDELRDEDFMTEKPVKIGGRIRVTANADTWKQDWIGEYEVVGYNHFVSLISGFNVPEVVHPKYGKGTILTPFYEVIE